MNYNCCKCQWSGLEQDLEHDSVDTCSGTEQIEMCPKCGSYEVRMIKTNHENDNQL